MQENSTVKLRYRVAGPRGAHRLRDLAELGIVRARLLAAQADVGGSADQHALRRHPRLAEDASAKRPTDRAWTARGGLKPLSLCVCCCVVSAICARSAVCGLRSVALKSFVLFTPYLHTHEQNPK